jgi:hypothetical protein
MSDMLSSWWFSLFGADKPEVGWSLTWLKEAEGLHEQPPLCYPIRIHKGLQLSDIWCLEAEQIDFDRQVGLSRMGECVSSGTFTD